VFPAAEVLRHPLQPRSRGRRDDGRRLLRAAHDAAAGRWRAGGRLGQGQAAQARCGPGDDGFPGFPGGHTGSVTASLWSADILKIAASAVGDKGRIDVFNFVAPQAYHRLAVRTANGKRVERLSKRPSYSYQLDAFCDAVLRGRSVLTPPSDSVRNMTVIDEIYRKAGLSPR
jgi:predicted dehydrogenase